MFGAYHEIPRFVIIVEMDTAAGSPRHQGTAAPVSRGLGVPASLVAGWKATITRLVRLFRTLGVQLYVPDLLHCDRGIFLCAAGIAARGAKPVPAGQHGHAGVRRKSGGGPVRYCLPCNATYEKDLRVCPDCRSRLLDGNERDLWLAAQEELTNQRFVPVHVLEGPVEEALLQSLLGDAGIPWIIRGHRADGFLAAFTSQTGWGVLLVTEEDIPRARELIELFQESAVPDDFDSDSA